MQSIYRFVAALFAAAVLSFGLMACLPAGHVAALSDNQQEVCKAIGSTKNCTTDPTGAKDPVKTVNRIIDLFSVIIGIVAVIMIMVGGFKYVTSGGDSTKVSSAKSTIVYAVLGLIVVALAQTIVKFVVSKVA